MTHLLTPRKGASWTMILMTHGTVKDAKGASQYWPICASWSVNVLWVCRMVCQRCVSARYTKDLTLVLASLAAATSEFVEAKFRCVIRSVIFLKWCVVIQNKYASIFHKRCITFIDGGCVMVLESTTYRDIDAPFPGVNRCVIQLIPALVYLFLKSILQKW